MGVGSLLAGIVMEINNGPDVNAVRGNPLLSSTLTKFDKIDV